MIVFDIAHPFKPKYVYRGIQGCYITSINFSSDEKYLLTSTKENGYLVIRESDKYYLPYDACTRNPVCFDLNNNLAFICEKPTFEYAKSKDNSEKDNME